MKNKMIYFCSVIQMAVGFLLLCVTICMTAVFLPRAGAEVRRIGDKVADASEALREVNASYCQSATNLFAAAENLRQVSTTLGTIGWNLKETGRSLHYTAPVLNQINGVGDSVNEIGKGLVNIACAILTQSRIIRNYKSVGHVKTSSLLVEYSEALKDTSGLLRNSRAVTLACWIVCGFGLAVSLLLIMNGIVLICLGDSQRD